MTPARYPFVLFDADHTLFDFDPAERKALNKVLLRRGFPATEEVRRQYSAINRALWAQFDRGEIAREDLVVERFARFIRWLGGDGEAAEWNRDYLTALGEGSDLLPGAEALCRALSPHCTLAIVTNGVALAQRRRFAASPLADVIPHLFISEETGYQKPQREYFDVVCAALGIADRSQAVVVGDNLHSDILGGINAGMDTVWYNPGALPGEPGIAPTYVAADYESLQELLLSGSAEFGR